MVPIQLDPPPACVSPCKLRIPLKATDFLDFETGGFSLSSVQGEPDGGVSPENRTPAGPTHSSFRCAQHLFLRAILTSAEEQPEPRRCAAVRGDGPTGLKSPAEPCLRMEVSNDSVDRLAAHRAWPPQGLEPFGTLDAAAHMPRVRVDDRGRLGFSEADHAKPVTILITLARLQQTKQPREIGDRAPCLAPE